jgi:tetratricopeptide (TPR) repeat protein
VGKNKKKQAKKKQAASPNGSGQNPAPDAHSADLDGISKLFEAGQYAEGIKKLQAKPELQQRSFLEQWGRRFMKTGDFNTAASIFKLVCQLSPHDDKAQNAVAVAHSMAGNQDQALEAMKRCTELAPDSWRHRFNLGKLYMLREEWENARTELQAAMQDASSQSLPQIHEYMGLCQQKIDFPVVDVSGADSFHPQKSAPAEPNVSPAPPVHKKDSEVREFGLSSSNGSSAKQPLPTAPIGRAERPLNILFVQEAPCIRNYKMACALRKRGHRVSLAYTKALLSQMYPGLPDDSYDECIQIRNNLHLWDISSNYELIHCHNEPDLPTVVALAGDAPVIHDTHDLISLRANGDQNLAFFEGLANRGASGRVYVSPYLLTEVQNLYKVKGPSLVFGNYVSQPDLPETYQPKLSAEDGKVHLVYEGGIGTAGHRNFSSLFMELAQKGLMVHIYPSHFNPDLANLFASQPNIQYNQPLNPRRIIEEMTRYDVGIIPFNIQEGNRRFLNTSLANKLHEYLAAGLPVVASDLVSYNDFFAENPVGFTFNNADDIINGLDQLRELPSRMDLRQYYKTYEGEILKMENFYMEVLGEGTSQNVEDAPAAAPWQQVETDVGGSKLTFSM